MFPVSEISWQRIDDPFAGLFPCMDWAKASFLTNLIPCYAFWLGLGLLVIATGASVYIACETDTPWLGWDVRRRRRWHAPDRSRPP
jgi:hypothetical protein